MTVFHVLGPLEVRDASGAAVTVRRRKQRALLALLLIRAGTPISMDELIDVLWDSHPPASARANLSSYISSLRKLLRQTMPDAGDRLLLTSGGYRLDVAPGDCDAVLFGQLAAEGRQELAEGRHRAAAERLSRALSLWRGRVLADLEANEWILPFTTRLQEARLAAVEDRAEARLHLGQHADLTVELEAAVDENPFRERLWWQYLLALHGCGRRTEAIKAYGRLRDLLRSELGVQPAPELRELYRRIERDGTHVGAPVALRPVDGPAAVGGARLFPATLPPDTADFTGRHVEISDLSTLLAPASAGKAPAALRIIGLTGMAGVGKTTLAVRLGHLAAPWYPDGQLYVSLRGARGRPLSAAEVLGRLLPLLGVDGRDVPADPVERAERYRTLLAGKRVLVALDDADSERQVRPLLPGAPTCAVVITGRSQLTGMEGARWTRLDVFTSAEATSLLARVVDARRVTREPAAAAEIVRLCGGLPLAVRIAGARLTARPDWRLSYLAALLRDERYRLDQLSTGDLSVRASLASSYAGLDRPTGRLFRRLGLCDLPDFPARLAAVILDCPLQPATDRLEALVDAHLLTVAGTDTTGQARYRFHDLVRLYARERAHTDDDHHHHHRKAPEPSQARRDIRQARVPCAPGVLAVAATERTRPSAS